MADNTKIEWADATLNYVNGCSVLSPGCTNCYAMKLAGTRLRNHPSRIGLTQDTKAGPVWTGEVRAHEPALLQALSWKRPRRIFWNAHGDLFHDAVPDEWIDRLFAVCALTPQHTHMILTKRSARMREYCVSRFTTEAGSDALCEAIEEIDEFRHDAGGEWDAPLPNVWLGVSVEDQARADERIPDLLATPAAVRFISAEPLLGPLILEGWLAPEAFCQSCDDGEGYGTRCSRGDIPRDEQCPWRWAVQTVHEHGPFSDEGMPRAITSTVHTIDWVIVGGESGHRARDNDFEANARHLRDQCAHARVAFFGKQNVRKFALPADLLVREMPL
mgnify:CR=1 FL=1